MQLVKQCVLVTRNTNYAMRVVDADEPVGHFFIRIIIDILYSYTRVIRVCFSCGICYIAAKQWACDVSVVLGTVGTNIVGTWRGRYIASRKDVSGNKSEKTYK